LIEAGDYVRFVPIAQRDAALAHPQAAGEPTRAKSPAGAPGLTVLDGGMLTTVQDLGRTGVQRYGVPVAGAMDPWALRAANRLVGNADLRFEDLLADLRREWPRIQPLVAVVSLYLHQASLDGKRVMFEGAQGTLLDIDHGSYPYVTSSNATAGGAATGLGIGPKMVGRVLGVAKAYTTRVGGGPLPTELTGPMADRLREGGQEYGASTGRPRRCGWYDAVAVRYAARVNGLDAVALTKMDVLDGLPHIDVCTAYRHGDRTLTEFPGDLRHLAACRPIYERLPGWSRPTHGVRAYEDLPSEAKSYIARLEELTGVPVAIISTGSDRTETIIREDSVAARWFGRAS
jgi:adenylosuccinate synthase